jgi:hypothetical protein
MNDLARPRLFFKKFINLFKYAGLSYVFFDHKNKLFRYSTTYTFWSSICLTVVFFTMCYNLNYFYYYILQVPRIRRFTQMIIYSAYLYVPIVTLVVNIIILKFKQNDIVKVLNTLTKFREHFKPAVRIRENRFVKNLVKALLLEVISYNLFFFIPCFIYPAMVSGILHFQHILYAIFNNYCHMVTILIEISHFVLLIGASNFFSYVDFLFRKASINKNILKMRNNLILHQELYDITKQINNTFSLPLLFMTGNYFIQFYLHVFGIYSEFVYNKVTETGLVGLYRFITIALKLCFYVYVANRTMRQVNILQQVHLQ